MTPIIIHGAKHRAIDPNDIETNPFRDLKANPIVPETVDNLIGSMERSGFWDNVAVRPHPTKPGKYQQCYGHNRLAALKDKRVKVETITCPVINMSDWEMYCAMVDENELAGKVTPAVAMENISVGCDIIERGLKKIGKNGTFEQFNEAIGRSVPTGTEPRSKMDFGFESVRAAYYGGEGLGRGFLVGFLPCGDMRATTISTILDSRYGEARAEVKAAKAKAKAAEAAKARAEGDTKTADKKDAEAKALAAEAKKITGISKDVLLMFDTPNRMTDFAAAVKKLRIPKDQHVAAANLILKAKVMHDRIERELDLWWDDVGGARAARDKAAEHDRRLEKFRKIAKGVDPRAFVLRIRDDLKDTKTRLDIAVQAVHLFDNPTRVMIERDLAPIAKLLTALVERSRETTGEFNETTPAPKMLTHRKG